MNSELSSLYEASAAAEDDEKEAIQAEIAALEADISKTKAELTEIKIEYNEAVKRKTELQATLGELKRQKGSLETELAALKRKYNFQMEDDLKNYVSAAKQFESSSKDISQRDKNAVEQCIQSIDEYMSVSI